MPGARTIDWQTAEVRDGTLSVDVAGDVDKAWTARLGAILKRLDRGGDEWHEIKVKKRTISVTAVKEGAEGTVRHVLEAAVMEADAELSQESDDAEGADTADAAMTQAFREFAGGSEDA